MKMALVGTPNCGKSTLFNRLCNGHAVTGNRAGVTVEILRERATGIPEPLTLLDLPGVYAPAPRSADEKVTFDALENEKPDAVLFVADGTAFARQIPLLLFIVDRFPTVLAVNMCDLLEKAGKKPDFPAISKVLGIPVIGVSARSGKGLPELRAQLSKISEKGPNGLKKCQPNAKGNGAKTPCTVCANNCQNLCTHTPQKGKNALCKDERSDRLRALFPAAIPAGKRSDLFDKLFLSPLTGSFFALLFLGAGIFFSFGPPGTFFSEIFFFPFRRPVQLLKLWIDKALPTVPATLIKEGLLGGVGAVFSFLPRLFLLFFFLSVLEDSGYLPRACALFDRPLRACRLNGGAAVPLFLGIGCSVPAILSTRHMEDPVLRRRTAGLLPFVTCSARLPVLFGLSALFFPFSAPVVLFAVLTGFFLLAVAALVRSKGKAPGIFAAELPKYRFPSLFKAMAEASGQCRHFCRRAGSVILLFSLLLSLFSHLSPSLTPIENPDESLLALLGGKLAVIFRPLGFGDWRFAAALLCGVGAKEALLSALTVFGKGDLSFLTALLSPAGALSFLVFFVSYIPCISTLSVLQKEIGRRETMRAVLFSLIGAYLLALFTHGLGLLFFK